MGQLEGEVAVVTGAARGIGRAIAERYRAEGAQVALLDVAAEPVRRAADSMDGAAWAVDVADEAAMGAVVGEIVGHLGEISILVNNAAAVTRRGSIDRLDLAEWERTLRVNLTGPFVASRAVLPSMRRRGGGAIIHVASQLATVAVAGAAPYCATKGAILQLTRAMALDHAGEGIRVNALSPGAVMTERLSHVFGSEAAAQEALAPLHPIGRVAAAEEIAGAAVFLASRDAAFMTGADLVIDGGYTAR